MLWSQERLIHFANEVQLHPELWEISHAKYRDRNLKKYVWADIGKQFDVSGEVAQSKFKSLRTYAKSEKKKLQTKNKSGSGAADEDSSWFLFKHMIFILSSNIPDAGKESFSVEDEDSDGENNEEVGHSPSLSNECSTEVFPQKKKRKMQKEREEKQLEEAYSLLQDGVNKSRNQFTHFGNHVAYKLSTYSTYVANQVQFKISQLLFEADMGHYTGTEFQQEAGSSQSSVHNEISSLRGGTTVYSQSSQYVPSPEPPAHPPASSTPTPVPQYVTETTEEDGSTVLCEVYLAS